MRRVTLAAVVALAAPLAASAPAYAIKRDETASSVQTVATFSFNYKKTRFGTSDFTNLHVTIDRAGVRLVDKDLDEMSAWPAGGAQSPSVNARDLDGDGEPEVLVDLYTGGANCCFYTESWRFDAERNVYVEKRLRPGLSFPYTLEDLNKDTVPEFRSVDYRFAYKYGGNVDTPRPLRIFSWVGGKLVDVTIAFPKLAAAEAGTFYRGYLRLRKQKRANVRGLLAAYLADSYNAGNGRIAWRRVIAAYRRGDVNRKIQGDVGPFGRRYLSSLRAFLEKLGYLRRA